MENRSRPQSRGFLAELWSAITVEFGDRLGGFPFVSRKPSRLLWGWENPPSDRMVDEPLKHYRAHVDVQTKQTRTFSISAEPGIATVSSTKPSLRFVTRTVYAIAATNKSLRRTNASR